MSTEKTFEVGQRFSEEYQGYTVTGWGIVNKTWEILSVDEDGKFNCKLVWDDTVMRLGDYTKKMTEEDIIQLTKRRW